MTYSYGKNYTNDELESFNTEHFKMLDDVGAEYYDGFYVAGKPKVAMQDISGEDFDLKNFAGSLVFKEGSGIVATGDNPFPCDTTRITITRWGSEKGQCGYIETASMLNHISLVSMVGITIGKNVLFGPNCIVMDTDGHPADRRLPDIAENKKKSPVVIEDNVWVGTGAVIMKGVTIGHHAVVAANSMVVKDVPPHSVVAGYPAKVIKQFDVEEQCV